MSWRLGLAVVRGRSMQPTLQPGDRLVLVHGLPPRPGGLAVVRLPGAHGEVVAVKRAVHREEGGWWVERDNPLEGVDSWTVGVIPDRQVVGRVLGRLWRRPRSLAVRR